MVAHPDNINADAHIGMIAEIDNIFLRLHIIREIVWLSRPIRFFCVF